MSTALIAFTHPSQLAGYGGWGNGYVAIPEGHPCFELDYDTIHDRYPIDVHYGLTFSERSYEDSWMPPETAGMWVVGFDTLHLGDDMQRWPDEASVLAEANRLKEQLEEIASGKKEEGK